MAGSLHETWRSSHLAQAIRRTHGLKCTESGGGLKRKLMGGQVGKKQVSGSSLKVPWCMRAGNKRELCGLHKPKSLPHSLICPES